MPVNKIKLLFILSIISSSLFGQINTYSPYSRFGIGDLRKQGYGQNIAMGTAGTAYRSNLAINYLNPASYTALDTLSFLFDFGLSGSNTNYITESEQTKLTNMNFHHIAIAFPFTSWWKGSAGISPISSMGFNIMESTEEPIFGRRDFYYNGNGGLNQLYFGTSVMALKKFSFGVNLSFLFGYLNNTQRAVFPSDSTTGFSTTIVDNRITMRDAVLNYGFQYHDIFADKYFVNIGATYNKKTSLKSHQALAVENYMPGSKSEFLLIKDQDTTVVGVNSIYLLDYNESEGTVVYPSSYSLGIALGIKEKLLLMGDYETQQWSEYRVLGKKDSLVNSSTYLFGMEYTPNSRALRGYLNRVHYRLGGYYSNSYLRIYGNQLEDYGITFGVGLPFKGTKTTFNLGMVLGTRGTTENNLIKENYGIINVSFTLHDFWFLKRKFD